MEVLYFEEVFARIVQFETICLFQRGDDFRRNLDGHEIRPDIVAFVAACGNHLSHFLPVDPCVGRIPAIAVQALSAIFQDGFDRAAQIRFRQPRGIIRKSFEIISFRHAIQFRDNPRLRPFQMDVRPAGPVARRITCLSYVGDQFQRDFLSRPRRQIRLDRLPHMLRDRMLRKQHLMAVIDDRDLEADAVAKIRTVSLSDHCAEEDRLLRQRDVMRRERVAVDAAPPWRMHENRRLHNAVACAVRHLRPRVDDSAIRHFRMAIDGETELEGLEEIIPQDVGPLRIDQAAFP